jgi:hypothetical protein
VRYIVLGLVLLLSQGGVVFAKNLPYSLFEDFLHVCVGRNDYASGVDGWVPVSPSLLPIINSQVVTIDIQEGKLNKRKMGGMIIMHGYAIPKINKYKKVGFCEVMAKQSDLEATYLARDWAAVPPTLNPTDVRKIQSIYVFSSKNGKHVLSYGNQDNELFLYGDAEELVVTHDLSNTVTGFALIAMRPFR